MANAPGLRPVIVRTLNVLSLQPFCVSGETRQAIIRDPVQILNQ